MKKILLIFSLLLIPINIVFANSATEHGTNDIYEDLLHNRYYLAWYMNINDILPKYDLQLKSSEGSVSVYTLSSTQDEPSLTFYFDEEGNALTDSFLSNEGKLRYLKDDGMMLRNKEAAFDGITYIIDGEGTCVPASQTSVYDETAMEYAKGLIGDIISAGMTEQQKADAIYDYVRTNYTYTTTGPLSDCAYSAFYGFRRKSGNCFEYAAVSHYLLSAAGFDDIIVARQSDNYHFWNLVRTSEGWRHFDTTPWEGHERMCLRDTKYLEDNYWDTNNFDKEAYPASL